MTDILTLVEELERAAENATPGEREFFDASKQHLGNEHSYGQIVSAKGFGEIFQTPGLFDSNADIANAELAALASPSNILLLCAEVKRLREALKPFADEATRRPWLASHMNSSIGGSHLTNKDLVNALSALEPKP